MTKAKSSAAIAPYRAASIVGVTIIGEFSEREACPWGTTCLCVLELRARFPELTIEIVATDAVQLKVLRSIVGAMRDGAALVLGVHEKLPEEAEGLFVERMPIYNLTKSHNVR